MDAPLTPLCRIGNISDIVASDDLIGWKFAIQRGNGPILVSPAMYDLLTHATPRELSHLMRSIKVKRLPR